MIRKTNEDGEMYYEIVAEDVDPEVHFFNSSYFIVVAGLTFTLTEWPFDYDSNLANHEIPNCFRTAGNKLNNESIKKIVEAVNKQSEAVNAFIFDRDGESYVNSNDNYWVLCCLWNESKTLVDCLLREDVIMDDDMVFTPYNEVMYERVLYKFVGPDGRSLGCNTFVSIDELGDINVLNEAYRQGYLVPQLDYEGHNYVGFRLSSLGHDLVKYVLRCDEIEKKKIKKYSQVLKVFLSEEAQKHNPFYIVPEEYLLHFAKLELINECFYDSYIVNEPDGWRLTWLGYNVLNRHQKLLEDET